MTKFLVVSERVGTVSETWKPELHWIVRAMDVEEADIYVQVFPPSGIPYRTRVKDLEATEEEAQEQADHMNTLEQFYINHRGRFSRPEKFSERNCLPR